MPPAEPEPVSGTNETRQTGPLADDDAEEEPRELDQETQVLHPGESVTYGADDEPAAASGTPQNQQAADDEPVATEPETEPSAPAGETAEPASTEDPHAADEVDREEPTLAEESRSHEFFDREEKEEGGDSRISRASRFLRRRE